jgi:integrase/recombinase XerD
LKKPKSSPWVGIVNRYGDQLRADGKSQATIDAYVLAAKQFSEYHKDIQNMNQITQDNTNKMFMNYSPRKATMNLKKTAVRQFLHYLSQEYGLKKQIVIKVKTLPRKEPQYLSLQEQDKLLQFARGLGEYSPYHIILKLLVYSGLRVGELINLRCSDISASGLLLREVKHGTTRRKRLKGEIMRMLNGFLKARLKYPLNKYPSGSEDFLFGSLYKGAYKPFTRQGIDHIVKRFCKKIGITKRVSPHCLRHSYSYRFLSKGGSILGLQKSLGHINLSTTQIYSHISDLELQEMEERL